MYFEFDANIAKFLIDIKGYKMNFDFGQNSNDFYSQSDSGSIYYHNVINNCDMIIKYNEKYLDIILYPYENINEFNFNISSDSSILLIPRDSLEFKGVDNESIMNLNYINTYDNKDNFKSTNDIEYEKIDNNYIFKIKNLIKNDRINIGISFSDINISNIPSIMSVKSINRDIYQPTDGVTSFAIYLFQGFYEDPQSGEKIIDYPVNIWNGIPVAGTVPLSSALIGNDPILINSYNKSEGLDSFIIYIEFVCNKIIANTGFAPSLYYDIIPPTDTAYHLYDQKADFIDNINGVSVYRGQYIVHKQSSPLYIDGVHKIIFRVEKSSYGELIFKTQVISPYAVIGLTPISDPTKIIA